MEKLKDNWPAAAVIIALIAAFVLTAIFAPPETQRWLFGAEGLLATLFGIFQRAPSDRSRERKSRASTPVPGLILAVVCATQLEACGGLPAIKPGIDVACHVARMSCAFVDTACAVAGSGGEAPAASSSP